MTLGISSRRRNSSTNMANTPCSPPFAARRAADVLFAMVFNTREAKDRMLAHQIGIGPVVVPA